MTIRELDVLHVIPGLSAGGAENMLANLVRAERHYEFRQEVVNLLGPGGMMAERIAGAGIPVSELMMSNALSFPRTVTRLARLIRLRRPRAIQSWLYYGDLVAYWAWRLSGLHAATRLYWGVRASNIDRDRYGCQLRVAIRACAHYSAEPHAIVANSYAGREYHRQLGYRPKHFLVIPNGIDTQKFSPNAEARARLRTTLSIPEGSPLVIHSARVDPMKDHGTLLAVAAQLPEFIFLLVGHGTRQLGSLPNTVHLGLRSDMPDLYAASDLAISTSAFGEGFPTAIAEAMASGLPVIATDVGDARLVVGDAGLIVPPRSTAATANAIRELLAKPSRARASCGCAARARIQQHFSLARAVHAFDHLHLHGVAETLTATG